MLVSFVIFIEISLFIQVKEQKEESLQNNGYTFNKNTWSLNIFDCHSYHQK